MARSPFPLQWPEGWPRKRWPEQSKFDKSRGFNAARNGALHQLDLFGAKHVVITSNLPTNSKGMPHSTTAGFIEDPGIAIWWVKNGKEHVIACDRWRSTVENMRAIERTLDALRGIDRWGATEMVERAFAGFAALPSGSGETVNSVPIPPKTQTWRELFGVNISPWKELPPRDLLSIVKARHREMIKDHHPDRHGEPKNAEISMRINAALTAAELELK